MTDYDVVIAGGGLMGSLTARSLTARGQAVLVLDPRPLGHTEGSSHGTSRIFRCAHPDPLYAKMAAEALPQWRRLEAESGIPLLTMTGGLDYGADRRPQELFEAVKNNGIECELLSAEAAAERFPGMKFPTDALYHPQAGRIDPEATIRAALSVAQSEGATIRRDAQVEALEERGDRVILSTSEAPISARHAILTMGPWMPQALEKFLPKVPMPQLTVTEQSVFHFAQRDTETHFPVHVCKHGPQFFGLPSGSETGSWPSFKIGRHDPGPVVSPDARNWAPDEKSGDLIRSFVEQWMPGLDDSSISEQTCLYTRTPNEDLLMDRRNLVTVASPCSGLGAKFAPVVGEYLAELAVGDIESEHRFTLDVHARK